MLSKIINYLNQQKINYTLKDNSEAFKNAKPCVNIKICEYLIEMSEDRAFNISVLDYHMSHQKLFIIDKTATTMNERKAIDFESLSKIIEKR